MILTYLIPCHLLTTHTLPSRILLQPYPHLQSLFGPICTCIKRGDLAGFDAALIRNEGVFVRRRIYLTLERGRDIALRNLFRKVFVLRNMDLPKEKERDESGDGEGGEQRKDKDVEMVTDKEKVKRTRIPVAEFAAAVRLGSTSNSHSSADGDGTIMGTASRYIDDDEVECLLANLIYKVRFPLFFLPSFLPSFLSTHLPLHNHFPSPTQMHSTFTHIAPSLLLLLEAKKKQKILLFFPR